MPVGFEAFQTAPRLLKMFRYFAVTKKALTGRIGNASIVRILLLFNSYCPYWKAAEGGISATEEKGQFAGNSQQGGRRGWRRRTRRPPSGRRISRPKKREMQSRMPRVSAAVGWMFRMPCLRSKFRQILLAGDKKERENPAAHLRQGIRRFRSWRKLIESGPSLAYSLRFSALCCASSGCPLECPTPTRGTLRLQHVVTLSAIMVDPCTFPPHEASICLTGRVSVLEDARPSHVVSAHLHLGCMRIGTCYWVTYSVNLRFKANNTDRLRNSESRDITHNFKNMRTIKLCAALGCNALFTHLELRFKYKRVDWTALYLRLQGD